MLQQSEVVIIPDRDLQLSDPPGADGRIWLSPALFVSLPNPGCASSVLFSLIEQPGGAAPALEVRCPHPSGVPWMTLEMLFGDDAARGALRARAIGIRFRAKALPAMTLQARCAFSASNGVSIFNVEPDIKLTHEFNLIERQLNLAGTALADSDDASELRIFLAFPRLTYFAAVLSHAELFWA